MIAPTGGGRTCAPWPHANGCQCAVVDIGADLDRGVDVGVSGATESNMPVVGGATTVHMRLNPWT